MLAEISNSILLPSMTTASALFLGAAAYTDRWNHRRAAKLSAEQANAQAEARLQFLAQPVFELAAELNDTFRTLYPDAPDTSPQDVASLMKKYGMWVENFDKDWKRYSHVELINGDTFVVVSEVLHGMNTPEDDHLSYKYDTTAVVRTVDMNNRPNLAVVQPDLTEPGQFKVREFLTPDGSTNTRFYKHDPAHNMFWEDFSRDGAR